MSTTTLPLKGHALRVYYDGLCPLCSREIDYYRTKKSSEPIEWIDITLDGFDATKEGLDPKKVHKFFHVKDEKGRILTGVDAFIEIWERIPALKKLKTVSRVPGAKAVMKMGYAAFAVIRPYLPRRKRADCTTGSCDV